MSTEGCIMFQPSPHRDRGMSRDDESEMSRQSGGEESVGESDMKEMKDNRSPLHLQQQLEHGDPASPSMQQSHIGSKASLASRSPRHITDSDVSECTTKKNGEDATIVEEKKERDDETNLTTEETPPNRPLSALKRAGGNLGESPSAVPKKDRSSSSNVMEEESDTIIPLHDKLTEQFAIMDISYQSTPGSIDIKNKLLQRLNVSAPSGTLQVVDFSRRGLGPNDAHAVAKTIRNNLQLTVLKLGYNNLGDEGAAIIAASVSQDGRFHSNLTVLDLGFNGIGDKGCAEIAVKALAGNHVVRTLFLTGNCIKQKGAMALAGAILHGCSLSRLHMSANDLGSIGVKALTGAIAEAESRRQQILQRTGGIVIADVKPIEFEDFRLDDVKMGPQGFACIPSMITTNCAIRVLSLSNNGLDDKHVVLLSQALARNQSFPIASLQLSFNKITCVGVESLMNAIWGSKTLCEIKLDNNLILDRGAQLCSVVLSSVALQVIDLGYNRFTTVGIKAIMKSLSENNSVRSLSMPGIPMDQNASKAVSYALAYNCSLESFNIDSCGIGYSGQRHIVAGMVSNRNGKLRSATGFPIGPITKTLGIPQLPEDWGNDRVLTFIRFMWAHHHSENGTVGNGETQKGPAPPAMVAAAAKKAFMAISESEEAMQVFQGHLLQPEAPPVLPPDATILVRSMSGRNLQIPTWNESLDEAQESEMYNEDYASDSDSFDRSSYAGSSIGSMLNLKAIDPEKRTKNLKWLRSHFLALTEVGKLPFDNADLWKLHQYFYSPAYGTPTPADSETASVKDSAGDSQNSESSSTPPLPPPEHLRDSPEENHNKVPPSTPMVSPKTNSLAKGVSFQALGEAVAKAAAEENAKSAHKRRSENDSMEEEEPCAKRAKNLKPRIDYYPRVREKLDTLGAKPTFYALSLLRQLKYIETVMLKGKRIDTKPPSSEDQGSNEEEESYDSTDVEMILLDLL